MPSKSHKYSKELLFLEIPLRFHSVTFLYLSSPRSRLPPSTQTRNSRVQNTPVNQSKVRHHLSSVTEPSQCRKRCKSTLKPSSSNSSQYPRATVQSSSLELQHDLLERGCRKKSECRREKP
jgi:hypothetical protein